MFFIFAALLIEYNTLKTFVISYIPVQKLFILAVVGFLMLLACAYFYFYSTLRIVLLLKEKISGLKDGALSVFRMPNKWMFLSYTFLIWFSYVLMFYTSTFALKETASVTLGTTLVAFVIGSLIIAFTNGGFGFFPIIIAKILFLYGIPLEAGNAFGWLVWTSQLIITVLLGIFGF